MVEKRRNIRLLVLCLAVIIFAVMMSYAIECDFGKVAIKQVKLVDESGADIAGILFRPKAATPENKMPAILNLHGLFNDKRAQDSFSIELARRGFVVLAIDTLGHGDSGGTAQLERFMSGSDPSYSMGANTGYLYLKSLPFVDIENLGIIGHSMGGIESQVVAALNPDHKAINPHASMLLGIPGLHNILYTVARFEEFFREGEVRTETMVDNPMLLGKLGLDDPIQWDTTYGDFSEGTARRVPYVNISHHFLTITNKAVAETVDWMRLTLKNGRKDSYWIDPSEQIFGWKNLFNLIAFIVTMLSLIPLTNILLETQFFSPVAQPRPERYVASTRSWWVYATVNALIGAVLFLPLTSQVFQYDKVNAALPFMKVQMANGLTLWYLAAAAVCGLLFLIWYRSSAKKAGVTMFDLGISYDRTTSGMDWSVFGKTLLLGGICFLWMYTLEGIAQWALGQEFRFVWPFMRQFSSPLRFASFWIYLIPALVFFLVNGGLFLFGQARQREYATPRRTLLIWWLKNCYACLFGLVLIWVVQYLPWFLGMSGPGLPALGLSGGDSIMMWTLWLQVLIPEFVFLLFLLTWFYRRTGKVYLGAIVVSSLVSWFLSVGGALAP
ncbi:MAG: hypothetical protein GX081_09455 [Firmicutes bacterium]|nr:hypothetical protein [Bacillota bacterium]